MVFFSCNNSLKEVQDLNMASYGPVSIAENINTKYTDSGRLTSVLVSPKMYNFKIISFRIMNSQMESI